MALLLLLSVALGKSYQFWVQEVVMLASLMICWSTAAQSSGGSNNLSSSSGPIHPTWHITSVLDLAQENTSPCEHKTVLVSSTDLTV